MRASLDWINQYLDRPCSADDADAVLTRAGFPVEGREELSMPSGLRDVALEVEVTSNRGDCLSHIGLAREIAAGSSRSLVMPSFDVKPSARLEAGKHASVTNDAPEQCELYTARIIRGVNVGPSPDWLVERLEAAGLRSVNNVVDITNFVLLEMGQPLHAFDLAKLADSRIVVREAAAGEPFVAIDGSGHKLGAGTLVIADAERPVAVAGVMGGLETEVGDGTSDLLLESARFDRVAVRSASRALKLSSDSSFRFERGVDPAGVERASRRAAALILELCGGELADAVLEAGTLDTAARQVTMRAGRCDALLGTELGAAAQAEYLERLGFETRVEDGRSDEPRVACVVPTHRLDIEREVDLIEEVARCYGYERIGRRERIELEVRPPQQEVQARQVLGRVLTAHGFHETITFSFVGAKQGGLFVEPGLEPVLIEDERRRAEPMLRPSLLPSLLICRKSNQDLGNENVRLFETGATWVRGNAGLEERARLALTADANDAEAGYRSLRGALEELVERLGGDKARHRLRIEPVEGDDANFEPAGRVVLGGETVGVIGLVAAGTCNTFDLKTPQAAAELDLAAVMKLYPPHRQVGALPRYPAIERDLSIVVDEAVRWQQVRDAVRAVEPERLESVAFVETYRGKPIAKGRKSVSFRMVFRDPQRTLRHEEVDPQVEAVIGAIRDQLGGEVRA